MTAPDFCKRCLYSTAHPLGLMLDDEGICSGCRVHEEKDRLDWADRFEKLRALVEPYRDRSGTRHDCIVPVSGAQDSYYIVHLVKEKLGLNPLLVTYNKYFNTPLGIRNLANLRIRFNCDILSQNVNPLSVKRIVRTTLRRFGSIYWPILAGQTVFPVQSAVRYRIPLIIWGAHQGLEQVGMFSHEHEVEMTRRYRKDHDLMGYEADDLLSIFDDLAESDIWQYRYPDDASLEAVGVRGIYLGNYVRWDPKAQHEQMMASHGYETAGLDRTFDCYDHVDCFNYMGLHDKIKLYKHGYSRVTDHASREIRHGRLSREQGLALVKRHEQSLPRHEDYFCQWLGIKPRALQFILDQHRNRRFWQETEPGSFVFKGWSSLQPAPTAAAPDAGFLATSSLERDGLSGYVTVGKGWY
ncbi:N-acetyl sugar amidotransferase [Laribacter hongkongensis]|uniref:N-acetyl sugar amidotransferase n=1 Tax=Laribacter hongkongensis TaxID=168471 RepID=UPI001EFEA188|nr:N-acetyl sugar amidotransferase [Laribacter hongkongensis]MCG8995499.1 N-acetyl sugar amidotransferase [Laribacter hongkongensis]MCG9010316.1 N-acetyl sugar amidotransferase [Laribacter hongkongensis]MCG9046210.1 N-acetyl sugar amidotransferase [Laribacter hongkongensis]MCG9051751.1 N-acetyl sugar amidotransferase [Laribacter hongkongensis]MCG9073782.1 N-acetyl sugar amidotransferase [Laribacter hongkongensis]